MKKKGALATGGRQDEDISGLCVPGGRPGQHRAPAAFWRHVAAAAICAATKQRADAYPPAGHPPRLHACGWPGCDAARHADSRSPSDWAAPAQRRQSLPPSRCEAALLPWPYCAIVCVTPPTNFPVYLQSPHVRHTPHRTASAWAGPSPHAIAAQLNTPHYFMRNGYRECTALDSAGTGTSPSNKTSERAPPPPPLIHVTPQRSQAIPTGVEFATYAMAGFITPTNQRYVAPAATQGKAPQAQTKLSDHRNMETERQKPDTPKAASGSKLQVRFISTNLVTPPTVLC